MLSCPELFPDIQSLAENISLLTKGLVLLSVVVALISAFVTTYAMDFIFVQRKRNLPPTCSWAWKAGPLSASSWERVL